MPQIGNRARAAILGASGYTGAELIRLLARHPYIEIRTLTADRRAGEPFGAVFPHLAALGLPDLVRIEDVDFSAHDIVFCCLPHGTTQETIAALPAHLKVVDLSADFRLADIDTYAEWYGHAHRAPELQKSAVYGLTEIKRTEVARARLVANPGCYPTSAQLPLVPLIEAARSSRATSSWTRSPASPGPGGRCARTSCSRKCRTASMPTASAGTAMPRRSSRGSARRRGRPSSSASPRIWRR